MFKQRKIGTFLGMAKIILANISPYANWLSLALVVLMSYYTTVYPLFSGWGIEIQFWMFCVAVVLIVLIISIMEYVFMMPSYFAASNIQSWESGGPLQDKLGQMEKDIQEIKELVKDGKRDKPSFI